MSFRCRQKLSIPHCSPVCVLEQTALENGDMVSKTVNLNDEVLPEAELFDLEAQLKAGINLEEVSSKVISHRNVSLPDSLVESIVKPKTAPRTAPKIETETN